MRAAASGALALLGTLTLALAFGPGCRPSSTIGSLSGLGCVIPLERGVCAPVPDDFPFEGCRLYAGPMTADPGVAHGQGWTRRADGLPDPCGQTGVALDLRGVLEDHQGTTTLVCNVAPATCPASRPRGGSAMACQLSDEPVARLGAGVTAAALQGDGEQLWAAYARGQDAEGLQLELARLDRDGAVALLAPQPDRNPAHDVACTRVQFWSRPIATTSGAQLLARCGPSIGIGGGRFAQGLALYSVNGQGWEAQRFCGDVDPYVDGVDLGVSSGVAWAALSIACTGASGTEQVEGPCGADGPLVLPVAARRGPQCDHGGHPLAVTAEGDRATWADVLPGLTASMRTGAGGQAEVVAHFPAGIDLRLVPDSRSSYAADGSPEGHPPVMVERDGSVVVGRADPLVGVVATRLDLAGMDLDDLFSIPAFQHRLTSGLSSDQLPARADSVRPVQWPSLALAEGGDTYAMCYSAGSSATPRVRQLRAVQHRGGDGDRIRASYCLAGGLSLDGTVCAFRSRSVLRHEACAVAPFEFPVGVSGASFVYLISPEGRSLQLVAPPDDYDVDVHPLPGGQKVPVPPLYSSEIEGDFGEVTDLQLVTAAGPDPYVALVGRQDGRTTAYRLTPAADGPTAADPLWEATLAGVARPRLRRDGDAVWVSYLEPGGEGSVLRRIQVHPGRLEEQVALPPAVDAAGLSSGVVVHTGPYANDLASTEGNAWLTGIDAAVPGADRVRVQGRRSVGVHSPVLVHGPVADPAGRWQAIAAFAPSGGVATAPGPLVTRISTDVTFRPQVSSLADQPHVLTMAAAHLQDLRERVLTVYLAGTAGNEASGDAPVAYLAGPALDPSASLAVVPLDGAGVPLRSRFRTTAGASDPEAEAFRPEGGAELVGLAPGVVGISFCARKGDRVVRRLQPFDLVGTPLGPAIDLGVQTVDVRRRGGRLDCPPATLVWHGDQLLSSSVDDEGVALREVRCGPVSPGE